MTLTGSCVKPALNFEDFFEEEAGTLYWKISVSQSTYPGKQVTRKDSKGYFRVGLKGKTYLVHRIVYYLHTKDWPNIVDHINGNPADNRIENLRAATPYQNSVNQRVPKNNISGVKGVCYHKQSGKFLVRLSTEAKRINLGLFDSVQEAEVVLKNYRIGDGPLCNP